MRLTSRLVQVAALLAAAGCGGSTTGAGEGSGDAGHDAVGTGGDASSEGGVICGGCNCGTNPPPTQQVSAAQACAILEGDDYLGNPAYGDACRRVCGVAYSCDLPADYFMQVQALNPDGGVPSADGGPSTLRCPTSPATLTVTCLEMCLGRLTEGYAAPRRTQRAPFGRAADGLESAVPFGRAADGETLAARAYLEAVSVHAFARLERELAAHGAPAALLRDARRARRDEVRHTAMTARLARTRGGALRMPDAPRPEPVRSLFDIAVENAVEGCVRETYGAVIGLVEAQTSTDRALRRAMQSIAADECRHAELAWAVHAWALPRLSSHQRRLVETAIRDAVATIARSDPRTAAALFDVGRAAIA